jgi:hypothetical protein
MLREFLAVAVLSVLLFTTAPVFAQPPEKTDGFVCPILGGRAGENGNSLKIVQLPGGDYTVIGPELHVPIHATNWDGVGTPGGAHAVPGDSGYTAIWAT